MKERRCSLSLIVFCARHLVRHFSRSLGVAVLDSAFIDEDNEAEARS